MDTIHIDDPDDPRVAPYATLRDGELGGVHRAEHGVFVAEGPEPVRELVDSVYEVDSLLVEQRRLEQAVALLGGTTPTVYVAPRPVFRGIVRFRLHQGIVALGLRRPPVPLQDAVGDATTVLAFEQVNDLENLGVACRSARALGAGAIVLGPHSCDPLYRRCVRVSMGHVLHLPLAESRAWPGGVADLAAAGLRTVALATGPDAVPLRDVPPGEPTAVLLGGEGPGLTEGAIEAADVVARIPMVAGVDSLNVGVAASIALFHLAPSGRHDLAPSGRHLGDVT